MRDSSLTPMQREIIIELQKILLTLNQMFVLLFLFFLFFFILLLFAPFIALLYFSQVKHRCRTVNLLIYLQKRLATQDYRGNEK